MKVRVSFTINVDPDAWMQEYGADRSDIRHDVQRHLEHDARAQLNSLGLLSESTP
ncbi:hypothetical protein JF729_07120 [Mycobacterium intracellulare]|uniref:hypothetical protein n=1 Tax=Mycobacterium intracellulare TaxID=1767 RepID=UPI001CD98D26|nr:hypothetical protein [Mycobacterium intracellulare]MCA2247567.1 hypothetical protein [Mycobacterium intracellulare]